MQRYSRLMDTGSVPSYLRSHPVTTDRISDAQARSEGQPYRQRADALEYHLVRARLRAEAGEARDAVRVFNDAVSDRRFANEPGARYGLAIAYLRMNEFKRAEAEIARLRADKVMSPMVETLAARARMAQNDPAGALAILDAAAVRFPYRRSILYAKLVMLQDAGRNDDVLAALAEPLRLYPRDARLHEMRAKAFAGQGKRLQQHQALAEAYYLRGALPAAIEQLQYAQSSADGNFYDHSVVDARLKEWRAEHARELQEKQR
jgi:predicted Zn-dependent protease